MDGDLESRAPQVSTRVPSEEARATAVSSLYRPRLWEVGRRESPQRYPRDSLRSRSQEGRPGTRKNRRWEHSVEIARSLSRVMARCGEEWNGEIEEAGYEHKPSAFYRLLEMEGPDRALELLTEAESSRRSPARREPRASNPAKKAAEDERTCRQVFSDSWNQIRGNVSLQELLTQLEGGAERAFSNAAETGNIPSLLWLLLWDADRVALETYFGSPPASELAIVGLTSQQRKVVHQFAKVAGLHSESRPLDDYAEVPNGLVENAKVMALRPPRGRRCGDGGWVAPVSVVRVLSAA